MFETTETPIPIIRRREDAARVHVVKGLTRFLVHSREVNGAYAIIEQIIPPGGGPPLHVHRHETEIFYVVDGRFEIHVGGQTVEAPAGASAVCPRDIPHTFRNVSDAPACLLVTIIPRDFGDYFERVDSLNPDDREAIRQLAASFGVESLDQ